MQSGPKARQSARDKILAAAVEVARKEGAGNLSLDAIAAQAGVSKGGLLYHFPNKAALMRALVGEFIEEFEKSLAEMRPGQTLLARYVELSLEECDKVETDASGIVAAMAEDPDFLKPVNAFQRRLLDRLFEDSTDQTRTLVVFLAIEGLRSQSLFGLTSISRAEVDRAAKMLRQMADEAA